MTDHFESEVQKFVSRQNGGELTPKIVYDMLKAVDADGEARHEESMQRFKGVEDAMADHLEWTGRDPIPRLEKLEREVMDLSCIRQEHADFHAEHLENDHPPRRAGDPDGADFTDRRSFAAPETAAEAVASRKVFTREQIVANFWILVGLLVISGVVNGLIDLLFKR